MSTTIATTVRKCLALGAASLAFAATQAQANTYWVVENETNQVFKVDVTTLTATLVGSAGVDVFFGGLGFARDSTLYAYNTNGSALNTVNQATGAFTLVGSDGIVFGGDTFDINPLTNRGLILSVDDRLWDVDLATGDATHVATTSVNTAGIASAFSPGGLYYELDRITDVLNRIDPVTGAVTLVGALGLDIGSTNVGYNPVDGFLYAIEIRNRLYPMYRIDPTTGVASVIGNVTGLPDSASQQVTMGTFRFDPVPEPASLVLLGLGLAGLGLSRRRKA